MSQFAPINFDDYAADMRELSTHASGIVRQLKRQLQDRDRTIIALLHAAGGSMRVPYDSVIAARDKYAVETEIVLTDRSWFVRLRADDSAPRSHVRPCDPSQTVARSR